MSTTWGHLKNTKLGTSLVVQWLRIQLKMQGTQVTAWSMATQPTQCSYWAGSTLELTHWNQRAHTAGSSLRAPAKTWSSQRHKYTHKIKNKNKTLQTSMRLKLREKKIQVKKKRSNVNPWLIHVNVWPKPLQYYKVISLQLIKIN